VPPGAPGTGVAMWVAVAPTGGLAILPVSQLSQKMGEGYRPFTFGELRENISALISANASLESQVKTLRAAGQPKDAPTEKTVVVGAGPSADELAAERQQQLKLERARMLYNLFMAQAARPPYQAPALVPPRPQVNCTSRAVGSTVYTDCH
jgi:hypothetical protein